MLSIIIQDQICAFGLAIRLDGLALLWWTVSRRVMSDLMLSAGQARLLRSGSRSPSSAKCIRYALTASFSFEKGQSNMAGAEQ